MLQATGTGNQAKTTAYTSSLPAGFYLIGIDASATGIPAGPASLEVIYGKDIDSSGFEPEFATVNLSQTLPRQTSNVLAYLEPGDLIQFKTTQFNFGGNPACSWDLKVYIYGSADVAGD